MRVGAEALRALVRTFSATRTNMLIALGIILFIAWILGFVVYHAASFAIHLLLIAAVISFVVHLTRGRRVGI